MTIALVLFVVICFVIGVSFLFRGFTNLPQADKIASREELNKANEELKVTRSDSIKLRSQLDELVIQFEETKGKLAWAEKNVLDLQNLSVQGAKSLERIGQLERDLSFLSQKADSQARDSIDVITRLATENEVLQRKIEQGGTSTGPAELTAIQDENEKLKIQLEGYSNKVKELEALTAGQGQAAEKLVDVGSASTELAAENENLKKSLQELQDKIGSAQAEAEKFRAEQTVQLKALQATITKLETENKELKQGAAPAKEGAPAAAVPPASSSEEELKRVRAQNEERILAANAALTKLNSELEILNAQIREKDERIKKLTEELLASKKEPAPPAPDAAQSAAWGTEKLELEKRLKDLQKVNQFLINKEKLLTFKLAQSRAQAQGLEKICEEYKYQTGKK